MYINLRKKARIASSFLLIFILTSCSLDSALLPIRSDAYQLGYKTSQSLQGTSDWINDYVNNIESWVEDGNSSSEDLSNIELNEEGCASLWTIIGLSSAIAGSNQLQNTPKNKKDFIAGCLAGAK